MIETIELAFSFSGKMTRSEFWATYIFSTLIGVVFGAILGFLVGLGGTIIGGLLLGALVVAILIITLASIIKRCRDCELNPWWTAACFIPYVGLICLIVIGCLKSANAKHSLT